MSGHVRTIADLARLAGVSAGTVSRALAGKALVNEITRSRIQALAAEHDFHPNQLASRLRTRRTGVIGVVVPLGHEQRQHLSDPFFMTMIGYLADALTAAGYDLMLSRVIPEAPDWLERIVDCGMLDGVLLLGQSDQEAAIERVATRHRPLVAWGEYTWGQVHCSVGSDNREGGRLQARRLRDRGATRIAYLGDVRPREIQARWQGICDIAADAVQLDVHFASEVMEAEIAGHVDRLRDVDGIAAASDLIAMTALRVLADAGVSVPRDVAVIGFDDLPLAGWTVPRLTTVHQDIARGAREMVAKLFARIAGDEPGSTVMSPTLVERDSG